MGNKVFPGDGSTARALGKHRFNRMHAVTTSQRLTENETPTIPQKQPHFFGTQPQIKKSKKDKNTTSFNHIDCFSPEKKKKPRSRRRGFSG